MTFAHLFTAATLLSIVSAEALPWANANPQAAAAAKAYAEALAEAEAIGHPDPEAFAMAASADDCATIACHAACGLLIIEGQSCSQNTQGNTFFGPYDTDCLCPEDSAFMSHYSSCMDCGWTLWKYYSPYVVEALKACPGLSTEPTGTTRCSTTLTDEYVPDFGIDACQYTGGCEDTTAATTQETSQEARQTTPQTTSEATQQEQQSTEQADETTQQTQQATEPTTAETTSQAQTQAQTTARANDETTVAAAAGSAASSEPMQASQQTSAAEPVASSATASTAQTSATSASTTQATVSAFEGKAHVIGISFAAIICALLI